MDIELSEHFMILMIWIFWIDLLFTKIMKIEKKLHRLKKKENHFNGNKRYNPIILAGYKK